MDKIKGLNLTETKYISFAYWCIKNNIDITDANLYKEHLDKYMSDEIQREMISFVNDTNENLKKKFTIKKTTKKGNDLNKIVQQMKLLSSSEESLPIIQPSESSYPTNTKTSPPIPESKKVELIIIHNNSYLIDDEYNIYDIQYGNNIGKISNKYEKRTIQVIDMQIGKKYQLDNTFLGELIEKEISGQHNNETYFKLIFENTKITNIKKWNDSYIECII